VRHRLRWVIALASIALMLIGCGRDEPRDTPTASIETATPATTGILPSGVPTEGTRPPADRLSPAAEPGAGPPLTQQASGRLVSVGSAPEGIVVDAVSRTVAVATHNPNELVLFNADDAAVTNRIPLPGTVRHLQLASPGGPVLVPAESSNAILRVDLPGGQASRPLVTGTFPHDAVAAQNGTVFVSNEQGGTVAVLRGDDIVKVFTDSVQPAGLAAVGDTVGMLDVRKNDLTIYDAAGLTIVGSTPAGDGPTHLVADKHGRMIAADTRGDAVRVFTPLPTPRQVGQVEQSGAPYGIAYDPMRDRLWVASSATNSVVGYDMAQQTPKPFVQIPTVQNPYSVAVDSATGRLFIAGVTAGVVQIIEPGA
jgi:DNA-binding beta-propeller fold protein YncE